MSGTADDDGTGAPDDARAGDAPAALPGLPDAPGELAGLGAMGGLGGLLESAQEAFQAQAEAARQVVEGRSGGGVVRVSMTGSGEVTDVVLAPEVVDPDEVEMLQDLIVAALRDAALQVTELQRQALGAFGGMDPAALGDVFGDPGEDSGFDDAGDDAPPGGPGAGER